MKSFKSLIAVAMVTFWAQASYAGIAVVGAMNMSSASISPLVQTSGTISNINSGTGFGGGVLLNSELVPTFSFEVGALYVPLKYSFDLAASGGLATSTLTQNSLIIPLALRFNAIPMLSLGGGVYYLHAIGNQSLAIDVTAPASSSSTATLAPDPRDGFGLQASARFGYPIAPLISMFADARYLVGLTNWDNSGGGNSQKFNHLMLLAGIGFSL